MKDVPDADATGGSTTFSAASLLEGIPLPAMLASPEGALLASNPSADAFFGLPRPSGQEARALPPGPFSDLWLRLGRVTRPIRHDVNGQIVSLTPVWSTGSRRVLSVLIVALEVEAGQFGRSRTSEFLPMLAHELRNPLAAI